MMTAPMECSVQRQTEQTLAVVADAEVEQLVRHGAGQPGHPGDAVAGLDDAADLLARGRVVVVPELGAKDAGDVLGRDAEVSHFGSCGLGASCSVWIRLPS
jgi:hypothetical protein